MNFPGRHGYILKRKDEVFSKFKEFKALIENHTAKKINTFRLENGEEFKDLCKDWGLRESLPLHIIHNRMEL